MRLTERLGVVIGAAVLGTGAVRAAGSPELLDLAARLHYGYYHRDSRIAEAAQAGLDRLADSPEVTYYRDLAALRRAQLGNAERAVDGRLKTCMERDVSARPDKRVIAEAWVLVAACALWRGDERRRLDALARARSYDADNPRILLVEAWALERAGGVEEARRVALDQKLAAAVEAFAIWSPSIDDPDWGHAEALTALAGAALGRGQLRTARDLVERALLAAPDYRTALELRTAIQGTRDADRRL